MYAVIYEKRVCKDLDVIGVNDLRRVLDIFEELKQIPIPVKSKKLSGHAGLYRIRQGDYRVVYIVDHKLKEVKIILVRHRKDSYRYL
jgi:mRNA interferase RelE/StbE